MTDVYRGELAEVSRQSQTFCVAATAQLVDDLVPLVEYIAEVKGMVAARLVVLDLLEAEKGAFDH